MAINLEVNKSVITTKILINKSAIKRLNKKSGAFSKISGPGFIPASKKTTIIIAVKASPGTPNASSGIIAAAGTALLDVSHAIKPSGAPYPNFDGFFDKLLAVE